MYGPFTLRNRSIRVKIVNNNDLCLIITLKQKLLETLYLHTVIETILIDKI